MSILRLVVLLFVIALFFPSTPEEKEQAYRGISNAVEQVSTFCVRNQSLCENSKIVATAIYDRVKIGAEMLFEAAQSRGDDGAGTRPDRPEATRRESLSRPPEAERRTSLQRSSDTLRREDRAPSWRGPGNS
jgi:hypothetical protein